VIPHDIARQALAVTHDAQQGGSMKPQVFDPFEPATHRDPYPHYRVLRDEHPAYFNEARGFWALSRFADVQSASRDWALFSSSGAGDLDDDGRLSGPANIVNSDPPLHDRLRDVVRRHFSPKNIGALEQGIRDKTATLLNAFAGRGSADLADELALPLPFGVVGDLLGIPSTDRKRLTSMLSTFTSRGPDDLVPPREAIAAADDLRQYFADLAHIRKMSPGDDLVSAMTHAASAGDITMEQVAGLGRTMLFAGYESTTSLITHALVLLHEYPAARAQLVAQPSLIPAAIEECLRVESPVQLLTRTTTRQTEIHGRLIPKGSRVALLYGAANRDERRWRDADAFDIHREPKRHMAFGEGIHFCLGAPLARLEARIVVEELLRIIPDYELVGTPERMRHMVGDRGFRRLPVVFEPRAFDVL
jgi:cytochrome P450